VNTMWKTGAQAGLVLLAGGALLLSGGVASATPGEVHAECSVVQLPGVDLQLGQPGSCLSVLLPPGTTASPPAPAAGTTPTEPVAKVTPTEPAVGAPPVPVGDPSPPAPVGAVSPPAPVQDQSLPYPCVDLQVPGMRISIGDASPPTRCFVAQSP
jgi:hypothetical protein